ncbi:unnamed protein product, partial [marine sediment metagenome]
MIGEMTEDNVSDTSIRQLGDIKEELVDKTLLYNVKLS